MFRALLGMPLIHKTLINIFLQKLPILQAQIVFYSAKTAKARGCINRAILEEKYLSKFYDVFSSWESTWSNKWVCEGCNTADIFKIFKRQILTALWSHTKKILPCSDHFFNTSIWNFEVLKHADVPKKISGGSEYS